VVPTRWQKRVLAPRLPLPPLLLVEALLLRLEQRLITYDDFKRGPIDGKAHRVLTPITVGMEVHMNNTRGRSLRLDAPSANANGLIQIRSDVHYHRV